MVVVDESKTTSIGDWVRFMRDGRLCIGEVRYIGERDVIGHIQLITDNGAVDSRSVLETRRAKL